MGWFDENAPPQQDWFSANAPSPTPQELSTLEAPEGSPQREDINRSVAGNLFAPPGIFAREPTLSELIDASMPSGVKEAMRDERRIPLAPPLPEQGAFEQGGLLPYVAGAAQTVEGLVPHSWEQAREMIKPPMGGVDIEKENELGRAWRGELGPVEQAAAISGTALQALPLVHLPFAETPLRPTKADTALVQKLMEARDREFTPPPIPPEYAERRFTMQPEPPPDLAPAPPIEDTLANIPKEPPVFNPELGPQTIPESPMPLRTEQAPPPIGTPLKPVPLVGVNGETPAADAAAAAAAAEPVPAPAGAARASVPVMITRQMEADLRAAGLSQAEINALTPQAAHDILKQRGVPETPPAPEPYTPEAAAARAAQPEETGISKAAIAEQREARELPAIERQKQIDFGESLDRAKATLAQDPMAGQRLVEELTAKPRSVTPEDTPLLIERMQQVQREFDAANRAVNEATPEQLEVAKARLEHARAEYDKTVTATQNATSTTGAGLNSVKMILNEDYSLARMESRKRAANNGKISEEQLKHTKALQAEIAEVSNGIDGLEQLRREGKQGAKSGKRFTDFMDEQAQKARERLIAKRGRLNAGIDPTNLVDEAIIGASHIARGLTKFADWSAQMVRDFGDRIKPFLKDLWERSRTYHDATSKAYRSPEEIRLERYKTGLAKQTVGVTAKIQRGDFTKPTRQQLVLDKAAYKMKGNLQRLKNEFERGVAKDAYNNMSPGDKFWQHFVGVERAMKLSSPGVFEKLGIAAAVREVLAPVEAAGGYAAATFFPRLAKGTRYGADLRTITRAEIKAKVALFTEGMKDAAENLKGKETTLEAMSDKYGRQPNFWYNRIGKIHAAVKAPVKRAEFVRSLEHRMDAAAKAGEDLNHPAVMDRLATESALDANRAIFQQNTVVSKFFSMLDKAHPAAGRTARFLAPVVRIPVNLFKELVTYHVGAPAAVLKIGHAYWKGVETLPPVAREAIIRQLVKGSVGGAGLLWGYYNREKAHDFFASVPPGFEHTPIAMAIHEGSIIKGLEEQGQGTRYRPTEAWKEARNMAKSDIPFAYTLTGLTDVISDPDGWRKYLYGMIQGTVVPQVSSWTAKELDKPTPFNIFDKSTYRPPRDIVEAVTQGIPGLREDIPEYHSKKRR